MNTFVDQRSANQEASGSKTQPGDNRGSNKHRIGDSLNIDPDMRILEFGQEEVVNQHKRAQDDQICFTDPWTKMPKYVLPSHIRQHNCHQVCHEIGGGHSIHRITARSSPDPIPMRRIQYDHLLLSHLAVLNT